MLAWSYIVIWEIGAGFWVKLYRGPRLLLCGPYYEPLLIIKPQTFCDWVQSYNK